MAHDVTVATLDGGTTTDYRKLKVDSNGKLLTSATISSGGATEYTEGATDTTITGIVAMTEGPSDTLTPLQTDASKNLKVAIQGTVPVSSTTLATETTLLDVLAAVDQLEGYTDGIEGLLTTGNTNTGTIVTNTGTTATNTGTTATNTGTTATNTGTTATNTGTIATNTGTTATNTGTIAGAVSSSRVQTNPIVGQSGVQGGSGSVSANTQRVVLATDVALPAGTASIGKVGHDTTGTQDGRTIVTTAGTRVVLAASTSCKWVIITAETDNTGLIVVGGTSVVASLATRRGVPLYPGESVTILTDDLNDINIDSTVSTDGVTYLYGT